MQDKGEQLHPDHYKAGDMDVIAFCHHHNIGFARGNVIKYCCRAGKKKSDNPLKELEDLKKARVYLDREIDHLEKRVKNKTDKEEWMDKHPNENLDMLNKRRDLNDLELITEEEFNSYKIKQAIQNPNP